jgi:hypothetical protein
VCDALATRRPHDDSVPVSTPLTRPRVPMAFPASGSLAGYSSASCEVAFEIPYESPSYRAFADTDGNGFIEGRGELFPLYLAAARDFTQPLFAYGSSRLVRLGVELLF